jgi:hypothetical protein
MGEESIFRGKIELLETSRFRLVRDAVSYLNSVDGALHAKIFDAPGMCVVLCEGRGVYFLLYQSLKQREACDLFGMQGEWSSDQTVRLCSKDESSASLRLANLLGSPLTCDTLDGAATMLNYPHDNGHVAYLDNVTSKGFCVVCVEDVYFIMYKKGKEATVHKTFRLERKLPTEVKFTGRASLSSQNSDSFEPTASLSSQKKPHRCAKSRMESFHQTLSLPFSTKTGKLKSLMTRLIWGGSAGRGFRLEKVVRQGSL